MVGVSVYRVPPAMACPLLLTSVFNDNPALAGDMCAVLRCGSGMVVSTEGGRAAL